MIPAKVEFSFAKFTGNMTPANQGIGPGADSFFTD